jgi:hypothetical protein
MIANNSRASTSDNYFCLTCTTSDKRYTGLLYLIA